MCVYPRMLAEILTIPNAIAQNRAPVSCHTREHAVQHFRPYATQVRRPDDTQLRLQCAVRLDDAVPALRPQVRVVARSVHGLVNRNSEVHIGIGCTVLARFPGPTICAAAIRTTWFRSWVSVSPPCRTNSWPRWATAVSVRFSCDETSGGEQCRRM